MIFFFFFFLLSSSKCSGWTDLKKISCRFSLRHIVDTSPEKEASSDSPVWIKTHVRKKLLLWRWWRKATISKGIRRFKENNLNWNERELRVWWRWDLWLMVLMFKPRDTGHVLGQLVCRPLLLLAKKTRTTRSVFIKRLSCLENCQNRKETLAQWFLCAWPILFCLIEFWSRTAKLSRVKWSHCDLLSTRHDYAHLITWRSCLLYLIRYR